MNSSTTIPVSASTNVFDIGKYKTTSKTVEPTECKKDSEDPTCSLPKALLIYSPSESGSFPVLLLLHGYHLKNSYYSQLMQHIASHGFIVVAPQLYTGPPILIGLDLDAQPEIDNTAKITNWLSQYLSKFLPNPQVEPNFDKLALSGHSRGGCDAFALALNKLSPPITTLKFSALIGIDPVAGVKLIPLLDPMLTSPPVLTKTPNSFDLDGIGVLVIGSGYGEDGTLISPAPCAPKGVNHEEFYSECCKPAYHFVVKDYGHNDVLDDETPGSIPSTYCPCKNGKTRKPMRTFVGGAMVAFLKAYLEGHPEDLVAIIEKSVKMPVELQKDEYKV